MVNLYFGYGGDNSFRIENYNFCIESDMLRQHIMKSNKRSFQNGWVEINGCQQDSFLYRETNGTIGKIGNKYNRKLIEDLIILGSIFTGYNWGLKTHRGYNHFPVYPKNNLECIFRDNNTITIEDSFKNALSAIIDPNWQKQFKCGFHLRMFLHRANIHTPETEFLGYVTLWEWLYFCIFEIDESNKEYFQNAFIKVLEHYWPDKVRFEDNVFHILRNQLAHSGRLPIDTFRYGAAEWMRRLPADSITGDYMPFFRTLTQIVVLKTLNINCDYCLPKLEDFLLRGQL
jgi:hypothetical protein